MGLFFVGIGWDGSQVHGDGMRQKKIIWGRAETGLIFTTVSLFTGYLESAMRTRSIVG